MQHENRSCHRSCSIKKLLLKISQYSQESLFNKVAGLQACNFVEKSLQHRHTYEILKNIYFTEYLQTVLLLFEVPITGWKVSKMEFFLLRIQSECKKTGTRKNFVFGHFSCSELDKHMSEWSFKGKQFCYWILNITFFWTGFSYDLQYKKLIFLFENLHRAIKLLNDFVNKFVCMFVCNGTFLLQTLEEFYEFRKVSPHTWPQDHHSVFSSHNQGKRSSSNPSEV